MGKIKERLLERGRGVVIYGPRQAGKTTLVNMLIEEIPGKTLFLNGDLGGEWMTVLQSREITNIRLLVAQQNTLVVDEAQRIPNIGLILKIIIDNFPDLKVIVTGSSSLDLANKVSEPLTGRVYTYRLLPLSTQELSFKHSPHGMDEQLEHRLIYGSYPETFSYQGGDKKAEYLRELKEKYLYKDILELGDVRNAMKIADLLKLLAFQVGSQVSIAEIAARIGLSRGATERYIDLLEKSFVIFRLRGFSRNLRNEVGKMDKIYFYDLGVRNAIINNFSLLVDRNDVGALWENFLIAERLKNIESERLDLGRYFWRLSTGAEIDYVEEWGGKLVGYEFKRGRKFGKKPESWTKGYPEAKYMTVNRNNWLQFVGGIDEKI
ncbi:MAG: ATP-binding protein [bacterium]